MDAGNEVAIATQGIYKYLKILALTSHMPSEEFARHKLLGDKSPAAAAATKLLLRLRWRMHTFAHSDQPGIALQGSPSLTAGHRATADMRSRWIYHIRLWRAKIDNPICASAPARYLHRLQVLEWLQIGPGIAVRPAGYRLDHL